MNLERAKRDAEDIISYADEDTARYRIAAALVYIFEHGYAPEGFYVGKKAELLDNGIPERR